ncbi:MAG: hypothetical protein ABH844_05935 [Candidatus Omnitrophota bacterium]
MRRIMVGFLILMGVGIFFCCSGSAEFSFDEAEQKAKEIHDIVATDIIYSEQEIKALYYQNIQIIKLLEDIKDLLRTQDSDHA